MTDDIAAVIATVQSELGDLIELLDRDGAVYARECADHLLGRPCRPNWPPCRTLPRPIALMIRDMTMDAAAYRPARLR